MLKKKNYVILLIIVCSFSMTSCINFIESIFFNKDGSGTYSMTVDMSEIGEMMAALGDDEESDDSPEELDELTESFEKKAEQLRQVAGISNIRQEGDMKEFRVSLLFDFKDIDALNRGMSAYFHQEDDGPEVEQYVFFKKNKKKITRTSENLILDALMGEMGQEGDDEPLFDPSVMFGDMYYELQIGFEHKIKSVSNKDYEQDNDEKLGKNMLRWRKYLFKKEDKKSPAVTIVTKK